VLESDARDQVNETDEDDVGPSEAPEKRLADNVAW